MVNSTSSVQACGPALWVGLDGRGCGKGVTGTATAVCLICFHSRIEHMFLSRGKYGHFRAGQQLAKHGLVQVTPNSFEAKRTVKESIFDNSIANVLILVCTVRDWPGYRIGIISPLWHKDEEKYVSHLFCAWYCGMTYCGHNFL